MIKQIFLDVETTGPDVSKHGLYQIGGVIRYQGVFEEFEFNCDIFEEDQIDDGAFELTHVRPIDLFKYPDPFKTHQDFVNLLGKHVDKFDKTDKFFFINFGAEFDNKFLRRWFESCEDKYFGSWFWMPPLEVGTLALEYLQNFRSTMPNFKLGTVCSAIGIHVDVSQTHTALYDAKLAMQLYDKTKIGVVMDFSQKQYSMQFRKPQIPEDDIPF